MGRLSELQDRALENYLRDLLHARGEAAAEIDFRRQELPYVPLLGEYQRAGEEVRDRLRRAALSLLEEATTVPWTLDALGYLLTFLEEAAVTEAIEPLKRIVGSRAWLILPEGRRRQMLALRTLLGLGWLGEPQFWIDQHQVLEHDYPALVLRALFGHGLEEGFVRLRDLVQTRDQAGQVLPLFPSLIQEHSLAEVKRWARLGLASTAPEVLATFVAWFESRGYGPLRAEVPLGELVDLNDELVRVAADIQAFLESVKAAGVHLGGPPSVLASDPASFSEEAAAALRAHVEELARAEEASRSAAAALVSYRDFLRKAS